MSDQKKYSIVRLSAGVREQILKIIELDVPHDVYRHLQEELSHLTSASEKLFELRHCARAVTLLYERIPGLSSIDILMAKGTYASLEGLNHAGAYMLNVENIQFTDTSIESASFKGWLNIYLDSFLSSSEVTLPVGLAKLVNNPEPLVDGPLGAERDMMYRSLLPDGEKESDQLTLALKTNREMIHSLKVDVLARMLFPSQWKTIEKVLGLTDDS